MNNHRGRTDVYTDCAGNDKVTFSCTGGDTPAQVLRTVPMELTPQEIAIVKAYLRVTDLSKVYFSASGNLILVDAAGNEYDAGYARGLDGDTPYIGEDNYWYIAGQSTGVPAYGLAVMPRIGANGNWFIGDTDTGVPARGEDYVLTDEDKQEIRDAVLDEIDLGGAGVPEVYIGDDEPENGSVLWVDTDDDSVDNMPGVTGASVGQIVRIEEVDRDGTPTKWAAVEPSEITENKLNNRETAYALALSEELMPDVPAWSGGGWTKTGDGGYAHTVGQTTPLSIALTDEIGEDFYLISFTVDSPTDTGSPDASVAFYPSVGGSDAFAIYDGNTGTRAYEKIVRSVTDGNLVFQPCDPKLPTDTTNGSFDGTIGNISVRRVLSVREANIVLYDENGNATIEMRQTPTARYNFYMGLNSGKNDVTGKGNVAIGKDTLPDNTSGFWNVALGQGALKANTVGSRNIAIGRVALQENTSGDRNVAVGTFALCRSHGFRNIAIGADAAWNIAEGNDNIAIGVQAMESCTAGDKNTVIGSNAVYSAETNVKESVAVGYNAIHDAAYMDKCVVIGSDAGAKIAGAESMVAIGYQAFGSATRASRSVAIGDHAGNHSGSLNDVICIGNYSTATKTGQTVIGGARTVETVVKGDFIVLGTDGVKRQIVFNADGTCSWTAV